MDPVFSQHLWGARSLAPLFPEKVNLQQPLGEAWLTGMDCLITNGPFAGKSLGESWRGMPCEWRGTRFVSLPDFPLLVKFIFPNDKLSIQVHPGDAYAAKHEQAAGGRGKTEMWHVVSAEPGAEVFIGLKPGVSREKFLEARANHQLEGLLVRHRARYGDSYFVPAGTPHSIGPGVILCEVQEYSDLTYRIYDYDRVDSTGRPRELHLEKALEVTDFAGTRGGLIPALALHSPDANKHLLAACEFFATERWDCHKTTLIESEPEQFQLMVILEGHGKFYASEESHAYRPGESWFLPASLPVVVLQPAKSTALLRIIVPDPLAYRHQLHNLGFDEEVLSRVLLG
jgi:mannose-6-phosphate isomerase